MSGKGSRSSSGGSKGSGGSRGGVKTPPKGNKRPSGKSTAKSEESAGESVRNVVRGREVEFWGIGLISTGIVLVLSMYLHMAGPLGSGIDTMFGWLLGLGRFALPAVSCML